MAKKIFKKDTVRLGSIISGLGRLNSSSELPVTIKVDGAGRFYCQPPDPFAPEDKGPEFEGDTAEKVKMAVAKWANERCHGPVTWGQHDPILFLLSRPSVPAMDAQLGVENKVLDHGFVRLIDYMGDETAIVQAARVSYGSGTKTPSDDRSLIRYLMRHRHSSPLEMCEIKLHVKLPIFTARQWIRHRTANVNEISARYSILDREFYVPALADIAEQSQNNKQGRGLAMPYHDAAEIQRSFIKHGDESNFVYRDLLNETSDENGTPADEDRPMLARELARCNLTLGHYTQWYWKIDLHNLLHFLGLRLDPHAQLEIRRYADVIWKLVQGWVPAVAEAFEDYRLEAVTLSRQEQRVLGEMILQGICSPDLDGDIKNANKHLGDVLGTREVQELGAKMRKITQAK